MNGSSQSLGDDGRRVAGITQDLVLRRTEAQRAALDRTGGASTAAEALARQLRGLASGLPWADRSLLGALQERLRRGALPPALTETDGIEARAERLRSLGGLPALDRVARSGAPEVWRWAAALPSHLAGGLHFEPEELRHARIAALAGVYLADATRGVDPADAFLAGLLHDVGRPYLRNLAASSSPAPRKATVEQLEQGLHPALGAVLLESWGLPPAVQIAVEHHHQSPAAVPRPMRTLARVVQAAHLLATLMTDDEARPASRARALEHLLKSLAVEPDFGLFDAVRAELDTWSASGA